MYVHDNVNINHYLINFVDMSSSSSSFSKSLSEDQTVDRAKDITICSLMSETNKLRKCCKDLRKRLVFEKKQHLRFQIENTKKVSQLLSTNRKIQSKYSDIQKHFQKMKSKCSSMEKCLENILDINVDSVKQSATNDRVVVDVTKSENVVKSTTDLTMMESEHSESSSYDQTVEHSESSSSDQTVDDDVNTPNEIKSDDPTPIKRKRDIKIVKERFPVSVRRSKRKKTIKKF